MSVYQRCRSRRRMAYFMPWLCSWPPSLTTPSMVKCRDRRHRVGLFRSLLVMTGFCASRRRRRCRARALPHPRCCAKCRTRRWWSAPGCRYSCCCWRTRPHRVPEFVDRQPAGEDLFGEGGGHGSDISMVTLAGLTLPVKSPLQPLNSHRQGRCGQMTTALLSSVPRMGADLPRPSFALDGQIRGELGEGAGKGGGDAWQKSRSRPDPD